MTHLLNSRFKPSEADLALELLQTHGRPMHYYELIEAVLRRMELPMEQPMEARQISSVLTQINLDSRFAYVGRGEWGLKDWVSNKGTRRLPTITLMNKTVAYDDDKDSLDEAGDELELDRDIEVDGEEDPDFDDDEADEVDDEATQDNWE